MSRPAAVSRLVRLLEERHRRGAVRAAGQPPGPDRRRRPLPRRASRRCSTPWRALTEQVAELAGGSVLTLGVGPTFAIRWLIPRLADLQRRQPGVEVRITTGGAAVPFAPAGPAASAWARAPGRGLARRVPLFAADLRRSARPPWRRRLRDARPPGARRRLLRVGHAPEDWPRWLAAAGLRRASRRAGRSSNSTARRCRRRPTGSASPWASGPTSTTTWRPAGWWRPSR